jgi:aspartate carbamoyltransferase catalytic subunit
MYRYDEIDRAVVDARTAEFREQVMPGCPAR